MGVVFFYAFEAILCHFHDFSGKITYVMIFYDFMMYGTPRMDSRFYSNALFFTNRKLMFLAGSPLGD